MKKTMKNLKERTKGIIIGMLIMTFLSGATLWASTTRDITVTFAGIRLVVNGNLVTPRDAQGNVVEPFIWNGTTYLPVRALADALGQEVHWDGATQTVYIGQRAAVAAPVPLFNRPFLEVGNDDGFAVRGDTSQNHIILGLTGNGVPYSGGRIQFTNHVVYALNMQATRFQATLNPPVEVSGSSPQLIYRIYGDGVLLYTSPILVPTTSPIPVDVDVRGKIQLRIETQLTTAHAHNNTVGMGNRRNTINHNNHRGIENAIIFTTEQ